VTSARPVTDPEEAMGKRLLLAFRGGKDTMDISVATGIPEYEVSRLLHLARNMERARP